MASRREKDWRRWAVGSLRRRAAGFSDHMGGGCGRALEVNQIGSRRSLPRSAEAIALMYGAFKPGYAIVIRLRACLPGAALGVAEAGSRVRRGKGQSGPFKRLREECRRVRIQTLARQRGPGDQKDYLSGIDMDSEIRHSPENY